jgi:hypothetical protein
MKTEAEIRATLKKISDESPYIGEAIAAATLEWVLGEKSNLRKAVKSAISGEDEGC